MRIPSLKVDDGDGIGLAEGDIGPPIIGHGDASVVLGILVLTGLNAALLALCWYLFAIGYKIKS